MNYSKLTGYADDRRIIRGGAWCVSLQNHGISLFITHLRPGVRTMFDNASIVAMLGQDVFFDTLGQAMAKVEGH